MIIIAEHRGGNSRDSHDQQHFSTNNDIRKGRRLRQQHQHHPRRVLYIATVESPTFEADDASTYYKDFKIDN